MTLCVYLVLLLASFSASFNALADPKPVPPDSIKAFQKVVTEQFERHDYRKVIELYQEYAGENPHVPLAVRVLYSQSLADTGQIDEAIEALQGILKEMSPAIDPLKLQYDLANLLFLQQRYDEARVIYQKILFRASRNEQLVEKARERVGFMKKKEGRKKDIVLLQILDIETALESGGVPDGAEAVLREIQKDQKLEQPQIERIQNLQVRIREIRTGKAKILLDEARRLFDEERNYTAVREILDQLLRDYSDVAEMRSVEVLQSEVNRRSSPH